MNSLGLRRLAIVMALVLPVSLCAAQEATAELEEFKSKEGKFSIQLPGTPEQEEVTVGEAEEPQQQFKVGSERGVYLISYQENPNLEGASPEQLQAALISGQDRLIEVFRGKLLESKSGTLNKKHPSLAFRITIPQASGEARCRFYMVGTRLYQVMAMGVPEFANSEEAKTVLNSFKVLP